MSQTKHRSFHPDNGTVMDEVEQKMHIKDYRKSKNTPEIVFDDDDEFLDNPHYAEVEYLLRKNR